MDVLAKFSAWPLPLAKNAVPGPFEAGAVIGVLAMCVLVYLLTPQMLQLVLGLEGYQKRLKEKRERPAFLRRSMVRILFISVITLMVAYEMMSVIRVGLSLVDLVELTPKRRAVDLVRTYTWIGNLTGYVALGGLSLDLLLHFSAKRSTPTGLWIYDLVMTCSALAAVSLELYFRRSSVLVAVVLSALAPRVFESFRSMVSFTVWTSDWKPLRTVFAAFIFMVHGSVGVMLAPLVLAMWMLRQGVTTPEPLLAELPLPILAVAGAVWFLNILHSGGLFLEIFRRPSRGSSSKKSSSSTPGRSNEDTKKSK